MSRQPPTSSTARSRTGASAKSARRPGAGAWVPPVQDLADLTAAARACQGCELFAEATQTVFGSGPSPARLMLVGEQPGDREDRAGIPFVGPAGGVLDRALSAARLDRSQLYLTNAVKHFRHADRGKRRLHRTPSAGQINACRPWLEAELARVRPELVVLLGATAGRAIYGPEFRIGPVRGVLQPAPDRFPTAHVLVTVHPSAVLRAEDTEAAFAGLVADLEVAAKALG
ncbi:MAG TPA: UdgX family uracil-DNA binding protein [Sporichthyaceae bacterium]|nr:UdgX family uracil-DNA binding protein [Sporichthyaceae bacterium]